MSLTCLTHDSCLVQFVGGIIQFLTTVAMSHFSFGTVLTRQGQSEQRVEQLVKIMWNSSSVLLLSPASPRNMAKNSNKGDSKMKYATRMNYAKWIFESLIVCGLVTQCLRPAVHFELSG